MAVAMRCDAVRGVRADLAEPLGAGEIDEKKPAPHLLLRVGVHACRSVGMRAHAGAAGGCGAGGRIPRGMVPCSLIQKIECDRDDVWFMSVDACSRPRGVGGPRLLAAVALPTTRPDRERLTDDVCVCVFALGSPWRVSSPPCPSTRARRRPS